MLTLLLTIEYKLRNNSGNNSDTGMEQDRESKQLYLEGISHIFLAEDYDYIKEQHTKHSKKVGINGEERTRIIDKAFNTIIDNVLTETLEVGMALTDLESNKPYVDRSKNKYIMLLFA